MAALAGVMACGLWQTAGIGLGSAASSLLLFRTRGPKIPRGTESIPMTIVPWGILLDDGANILHWPSIRSVAVKHVFARDQASDMTVSSVVFIETERATYAAHAPGEVHLDRLLAYVEDYAKEAAHEVALDLGCDIGVSSVEPVCAQLTSQVRAILAAPPAALGTSARDYRGKRLSHLRRGGRTRLVDILRDRTPRLIDPRPMAALLAAEFGVEEAKMPLANLVQSPHPIVAATAKAAATRLGVSGSRVGTLDELGPFLADEDRDVLEEWVGEATL